MMERMISEEEEPENCRSSSSSSGDGGENRTLTVDWRGRPCNPNKNYGGMKAAVFVLGFQALEIMAVAGVGNNLITFVFNDMHFSLSESANIVTNFVGTMFLLSLLGGFLSDSYLGTFTTILIFSFVELIGLILLSIQAQVKQLRPVECNMRTGSDCDGAKGYEKLVFFMAIFLVALGSGCLKPNIIAHGAIQLTNNNNKQKQKQLSSYFNVAYFAFCVGELVALTLFVWIQTRWGMGLGFGVSAGAMGLALLCFVSAAPLYRNASPAGSIFKPIAQVFVAAFSKRKQIRPTTSNATQTTNEQINHTNHTFQITNKFRFLEKASMKSEEEEEESPWRVCSAEQVEQVKRIVCVIPIFGSTIIFNTILAQLQTFSVQQAAAMDTRLFSSSYRLPPASLQAIPYLLLVFLLLPLYQAAAVSTRLPALRPPLRRVAAGLFAATFSMVAAALVESRRRPSTSVLWLAPQYLIFGVSEMLTAVGLVEFFYSQSLDQGTTPMRSFLTALTYCSYSLGFFLSSALVSVVDRVTRRPGGDRGWLGHNDLDQDRLDLFYWLLAALSLLNFCNFLFWLNWYSSLQLRPSVTVPTTTTVNGQRRQCPQTHISR